MHMAENNPARKSFEGGARAAREALEKGTATVEQAAREAEHGFSSAGEGFRDFNAKLMDFGQANVMAGLNFVAELARVKAQPRHSSCGHGTPRNKCNDLTSSRRNSECWDSELLRPAASRCGAVSSKRSGAPREIVFVRRLVAGPLAPRDAHSRGRRPTAHF
jgi:hypothetical protein